MNVVYRIDLGQDERGSASFDRWRHGGPSGRRFCWRPMPGRPTRRSTIRSFPNDARQLRLFAPEAGRAVALISALKTSAFGILLGLWINPR